MCSARIADRKRHAMRYKTILVHADKSRHMEAHAKLAAAIALKQDAHLIGAAATGIAKYISEAALASDLDPDLTSHLTDHIDLLRQRARDALLIFERTAAAMGVRSYETMLMDDEAGASISMAARCCDLVVLGQTDPDEPSPAVMPDFPEFVVLHGGRPVLILPCACSDKAEMNRILVAWNASIGAARAVTAALPLLVRARLVEIAVLGAGRPPDELDAMQLAQYLARHDVPVEVVCKEFDRHVGDALLALAAQRNADMVVMGGYGHSRFREILLGGVTRTMLESMARPVLMAH